MTEIVSTAGIAAITVICWLICEIAKMAGLNTKWLPALAGICGGILGIAAMRLMPAYPASDVMSAVADGITSGLAATGIDQMVKQIKNE